MKKKSSNLSQGRTLQPDEVQLWKKVTDSVVPSDERDVHSSFEELMRQHDIPQAPRPVTSRPKSVMDPAVGGTRSVVRPTNPAGRSPGLGDFDHRQKRQISRGHIEIDAVLDLHGMRQDEAHGALKRFLVQSQARGARYVTVITGKGRRVDHDDHWGERERGVLRRVVRTWLEDADFRSLIVSYTTAPRNHGGEGALFVHVRRANKPRRQ